MVTKPRAGAPPLWLDFGLRTDPATQALHRAQRLYTQKHRAQAEAIFSHYRSLDAQVGAAFARWPDGSLDSMKRLVASHPRSSLAALHLGWALYWSGRDADAVAAWRRAEQLEPDSPAAVDAQTALHPEMFPGLPYILTAVPVPPAVAKLPPADELRALARRAGRPDANAKLVYGIALWNLRRPVSAARQFRAAAALAPDDPMAQTAAAVGAFSKDQPVRAFGRLGPLTGRFPQAAVVRFHLGVLLLWTRKLQKAEEQLRLAVSAGPSSVFAMQAKRLIALLPHGGTR
jgi:predicted Zn-dependent protease